MLEAFFFKNKNPKTTDQDSEANKKPYYIEVIAFEDLKEEPSIQKNGRLLGAQDITVSSQVAARVKDISATIGAEVSADTPIVKLEDNSGVYTFNAQRAATALSQAQISYESTMLSIDKALTDTQLALEQANTQYNSSTYSL
ncbi:MAG: hypothetical protein H6765_05155 [Candidatus Peribacteria bacterium]|nr:MAG: hypothetical protein H6765_05155 [Candidatus Peribacteria bacterium]